MLLTLTIFIRSSHGEKTVVQKEALVNDDDEDLAPALILLVSCFDTVNDLLNEMSCN